MNFVTNHLNKILILNGIADIGFLLAPPLIHESRSIFSAKHSASLDVLGFLVGCFLSFHGIVRIFAGLNVTSKTARRVAVLSYWIESAWAIATTLLKPDDIIAERIRPMIFVPLVGSLVVLFLYAEPVSSEKKK